MPYSLQQLTDEAALHPHLEPVSAWLFRSGGPLLAPERPDPMLEKLIAMPIGLAGFDPAEADQFRMLLVDNPGAGLSDEDHRFLARNFEDELDQSRNYTSHPMASFLPMPAEATRPGEALLRFNGFGSPRSRPTGTFDADNAAAIIGVIDHGINIFHERSRHGPTGSRIAAAWFQAATFEGGPVPFGHEWTQPEIEAALDADGDDEDALLRRIGADFTRPGWRPLAHRATHGTHVLDLAAGMPPDEPEGRRYPIIAVTLPPVVLRETSGSMLAIPLALGLEYIANRARALMLEFGRPLPLFVNLSLGLAGGPRGGQHRLERTIANVARWHRAGLLESFPNAEAPPIVVTVAAGNNHLARGHAAASSVEDGLTVGWHLQPGDPTANFCEIRFSYPEVDLEREYGFEVTLMPPEGNPTMQADFVVAPDANQPAWLLLREGTPIGRISGLPQGQDAIVLTLALEATDPGLSDRVVAPSGTWTITARAVDPAATRIDAWILRDDVPGGFRDAGRQSRFVDPAYRTHGPDGRQIVEDPPQSASAVRREGSLNALSTDSAADHDAWRIVRVGGYATETSLGPETGPDGARPRPASYSAAPLSGTGEAIDYSAKSDRSPVLLGIRAAGTRSGSTSAISGTSAAAPQVLRALAMGHGAFADVLPSHATPRLGHQFLRDNGED